MLENKSLWHNFCLCNSAAGSSQQKDEFPVLLKGPSLLGKVESDLNPVTTAYGYVVNIW